MTEIQSVSEAALSKERYSFVESKYLINRVGKLAQQHPEMTQSRVPQKWQNNKSRSVRNCRSCHTGFMFTSVLFSDCIKVFTVKYSRYSEEYAVQLQLELWQSVVKKHEHFQKGLCYFLFTWSKQQFTLVSDIKTL